MLTYITHYSFILGIILYGTLMFTSKAKFVPIGILLIKEKVIKDMVYVDSHDVNSEKKWIC